MLRIAIPLLLLAVIGLISACAPQKLPSTKIGKPYSVNGQTYYPSHDAAYDKVGEASWYGPGFHGNFTASGEKYDQYDLTAAHPTLPMPSLVRVTNLSNGKSVVIRINDRGPFAANRIIDLSKKSADALGIRAQGTARVRVQYLERETQDYIAAVKSNDNRIIRMADYNARVERQRMASAAAAATPAADNSFFITNVMADETRDAVEPVPTVQETSLPPVEPQTSMPDDAIMAEPFVNAAEAPVEEPMPMAMERGRYAVQLGSFASEENARRLAKKVSGVAHASVERVEVNGRSWWRVRIEGLKDRYAADTATEEVRALGVREARVIRQ